MRLEDHSRVCDHHRWKLEAPFNCERDVPVAIDLDHAPDAYLREFFGDDLPGAQNLSYRLEEAGREAQSQLSTKPNRKPLRPEIELAHEFHPIMGVPDNQGHTLQPDQRQAQVLRHYECHPRRRIPGGPLCGQLLDPDSLEKFYFGQADPIQRQEGEIGERLDDIGKNRCTMLLEERSKWLGNGHGVLRDIQNERGR
ncbi:MAG TPA: hypothetical protein VE685_27285 [Thermoanaerobaculia bacterium]|nr:hypothetical protein [Thermoanaerobaculia bacterium]